MELSLICASIQCEEQNVVGREDAEGTIWNDEQGIEGQVGESSLCQWNIRVREGHVTHTITRGGGGEQGDPLMLFHFSGQPARWRCKGELPF